MLESTKQKYLKNAQGFFDRHLFEDDHAVDKILYALHKVSAEYTAKSFSNLKSYLAFYLEHKGHPDIAMKVRRFENRMTKTGNCHQTKIKTLSDDDFNSIIDAVKEYKN